MITPVILIQAWDSFQRRIPILQMYISLLLHFIHIAKLSEST